MFDLTLAGRLRGMPESRDQTPADPAPPAVAAALRALLPADVASHQRWIADVHEALHPDEARAVARAVDKRRREFAAGRHCARIALQALGVPAVALPAGPTRAPQWPAGVVGSISHDEAWSVAAVALQPGCLGIGVDVELIDRFQTDQARIICTPAEARRGLAGLHGLALQRAVARCFTIKEAVFKAQHPLTGAWLDFADVEVELEQPEADSGRFHATLRRAAGPYPVGHVFSGGSACAAERACAVLVLR